MDNILNNEPIAKRRMVFFVLCDVSGSMNDNGKIQTVNDAMRQLLPELAAISNSNIDSEIAVTCLTFGSEAKWLCQPTEADCMTWNDLTATGQTNLADALKELNKKLSPTEYLNVAGYAPVILLMSDGIPSTDYSEALSSLKQNRYYQKAIKMAIAIGDDAKKNVLADVVGNSEMVLPAYNKAELLQLIQFLSVAASSIGSRSCAVGVGRESDNAKQEQMIEQIREYKQDMNVTDGF